MPTNAPPPVETVTISRLFCSPTNPRNNDAAVPHVAASLRRFGWQQPIVARRSGEVIAGNTRLKAAQSLGMTEVPVWCFDGTDIDAVAFSLADNRTHEWASWNEAELAKLLDQLRAEDSLEGVGYSTDDIDALVKELRDQEEIDKDLDDEGADEPAAQAYAQRGDLWHLGPGQDPAAPPAPARLRPCEWRFRTVHDRVGQLRLPMSVEHRSPDGCIPFETTMHFIPLSLTALAACLAAPIHAQTPSVAVTLLTHCTTSATISGISTSQMMPAGGPQAYGVLVSTLQAGSNLASASTAWSAFAQADRVLFQLSAGLQVTTPLPSTVTFGTNEYLIEFHSDAPAPARLDIRLDRSGTAGVALPLLHIDYGNDGTIDVFNVPSWGISQVLSQWGVQPVVMRIITTGSLSSIGTTWYDLLVQVVPDNDLTVTRSVLGCSPQSAQFAMLHSFVDRGLLLLRPGVSVYSPVVAVFGLGVQPQLLPPTAVGPCLLLPSPDVVVWLPTWANVHVALPSTVRPFTFWVQAVAVEPTGLELTDGYRVDGW